MYLYFFNLMTRRHTLTAVPQRSDVTTTTHANVSLRSADTRRDVDAIASLRFQVDSLMAGCEFLSPVSIESVKDDVGRALADANHRFYIAQDASGNVIGVSQLSRYEWNPPDKQDLQLIIAPAHLSQGIDDALYADVVTHCAEHKVFHLATSMLDNDPDLLRSVRKRGFTEVHHQINFELDLTTFDSSRFDGLIERVQASGIRISNLAEMGNTEEAQRKLFSLNSWCATLDLPGVKDEPAWNTWEGFKQTVCESWWYQPEGQTVAVDEQTGEWIGMCAVTANARHTGGDVMHTGVDRRYRRDPRIGQALKLTAIQYCIRKGAHKLGDNHDARDATNLALNYTMGFKALPSVISLEASLNN